MGMAETRQAHFIRGPKGLNWAWVRTGSQHPPVTSCPSLTRTARQLMTRSAGVETSLRSSVICRLRTMSRANRKSTSLLSTSRAHRQPCPPLMDYAFLVAEEVVEILWTSSPLAVRDMPRPPDSHPCHGEHCCEPSAKSWHCCKDFAAYF